MTQTFVGHIVDIHNQSIFRGEISVEDGHITSINHREDVDATAPYFLPGLCDAHIHIESSMMIPEQFAKVAVRHGVVAAMCDPHEIANVLGMEGVDFMIENAQNSRFNFYFGLPSCVPSTHLETAGATITAEQTKELIKRKDIWFLAEMMNFPGLFANDKEVWNKIAAAKAVGKPIDGHAPCVRGEKLRQYVNAGISTDHECTSLEEAQEKASLNMQIMVREGSAARNFEALYPIISQEPEKVMLCSDDKHPDGLMQGHIDALVRRGIQHGISIWDLLRAACVNPVRHYKLPLGQLREGDDATFIAVDNLSDFNIQATIISGYKVYDSRQGVNQELMTAGHHPVRILNKFEAKPINEQILHIEPCSVKVRVIEALDGELYTPSRLIEFADLEKEGVQKIMVYNRYGEGRPQVGFIQGFHLTHGAIGATIAHDSHNIVVIGADDKSMVTMANALIEAKGGIGYVENGQAEILPLPIAGLMSAEPAEQIAGKYHELIAHARSLGCKLGSPFITMSFMALPVIPELKLTDKGLVDISKFDFVDLFVKED